MMEEILDRFAGIAGDPLSYARQWKEKGKGKVVGCNGLYVPEEIIHAAGMLPVVILEKEGRLPRPRHICRTSCADISAASLIRESRGIWTSWTALWP